MVALMAYGLRIRNGSDVVLDTSVRLVRLIDVWNIAGAQISSGINEPGWISTNWYYSPVYPGLADDGTWMVDAPGTTNQVEFLGDGRFRICFFIIYQGFSDIPVTVWRY